MARDLMASKDSRDCSLVVGDWNVESDSETRRTPAKLIMMRQKTLPLFSDYLPHNHCTDFN